MQLLAYGHCPLHGSKMALAQRAARLQRKLLKRSTEQIKSQEKPQSLADTESSVISIITLLLPTHAPGLGSWHEPTSDRSIDKRILIAHQQMQHLLLLPHQACAVLDRVAKTKSLLLMFAVIILQIR